MSSLTTFAFTFLKNDYANSNLSEEEWIARHLSSLDTLKMVVSKEVKTHLKYWNDDEFLEACLNSIEWKKLLTKMRKHVES